MISNTINFLDGKKTTISAIGWPIFQLCSEHGWITGTASTIVMWALTSLTGVGLGHKALKAKSSR